MKIKTLLACLIGILFFSTTVQAQYFVKDGKQIPLKPSTRYIAIKLKGGIAPSDATFTSAVVANSEHGAVLKQSAVLAKHGIVVIQATAGIPPQSPTGPHFTAAAADIGQPVPVYQWGDGDAVLTSEVVFKPTAAAKNEVLRKLSSEGQFLRPIITGHIFCRPATRLKRLTLPTTWR